MNLLLKYKTVDNSALHDLHCESGLEISAFPAIEWAKKQQLWSTRLGTGQRVHIYGTPALNGRYVPDRAQGLRLGRVWVSVSPSER